MKYPGNRDLILQITDKDKAMRFEKILAAITRDYEIQTEKVGGYTVRNIVICARRQKGKITVVAHHDVFPGSFGYNDNSSGVVTLLKLQEKLPDNVELVFTDREENSGCGCEAYLSGYSLPRIAINVDVVGLEGRIFFEKYGDPNAIHTGGTEMELFEGIPFSDSYILKRAGVPNILLLAGPSKENLIEAIFQAQHRSPGDGNIELISEDTMDRVLEKVKQLIKNNS